MRTNCGRGRRGSGFTLVELLAIVVIVFVLAAVLFPVFAKPREHGPRRSCLSNEKQVAMGFLQYTQDFDELYPPAYTPVRGVSVAFARDVESSYEDVLWPYVKNVGVFQCPNAPANLRGTPAWDYIYNDLLIGTKTEDVASPSHSILIAEGDAPGENIGHAWIPNTEAMSALFDGAGKCLTGQGATVQTAPTRHMGGANYAFADGHVKLIMANQVFFPPRTSARRTHKDADGIAVGPDPDGDMAFAGTTYKATFHLR